jgi:hypothetical protein
MGQFALGIRSLLVKAGVFVVLAALLAWALGGTLFPRPARAEFPALRFHGQDWYWRLSVPYRKDHNDRTNGVRWELMYRDEGGEVHKLEGPDWHEVAGPVHRGGEMCFGGIAIHDPSSGTPATWTLVTVNKDYVIADQQQMLDRLAVEQQLARLQAGLPLQDEPTILAQRSLLLDPQPNPAEDEAQINSDERR